MREEGERDHKPHSQRVVAHPVISTADFQIHRHSYPPDLRQERHAHGSTNVTLVLSGVLRERVGSMEEQASPLSVVVKPAGVEHADVVGPRTCRTAQLVLSDTFLGDAIQRGGLGEWRWLHARPVAAAMARLLQFARRSPAPDVEEVEGQVLDVVALLCNSVEPRSSEPPSWLQRVKQSVDDQLDRSVPVRALAEATGVHPVSLARAFRRCYGTTVTEYRTRERVKRAAACLAESGSPIGRIAHATGFSDHSHLCREFQCAAGVTPSRFREMARQWS
ncbi:MAG: AraC family transcriptional regulator [Acidobacteriota bacterium]